MSETEQLTAINCMTLEKHTQVQLAYWKQQLANAPTLELPTDRPRQRQQTYTAAQSGFTFSRELIDALKLLSHNTDTTLYMTLVAAFKIVLQRYSCQDDILIGSTTYDHTNRDGQLPNDVLVNTLVLRTDLSRNPTFLDLLKQVSTTIINADTHANVPFEYLIKELNIEHDTIQVLITLEPSQLMAPRGQTIPSADINATNFNIALKLSEQPDGLDIQLEYNTNLWNPETVQRMVDHWRTILETVATDPTQHIADLPMLTEAERKQLLVTWNDTTVDYPAYTTLCQLFEAQVERRPDATAVTSIDGTLSYQELNGKANRLARMLRKRGVQADTLVGICMDRSTDMLVALLGILKAGGAYVPIDPAYPADRIAYMLQDSQVQCLLTQQHLVPLLAPTAATIICLDLDQDQIAQEAAENVTHTITADNLAYILYTSGSTGRPKGVQIPHRGLINFELAMRDLLKITEDDTFLAITTLSFDIAGLELYLPLISGAQVSIETREVAIDGHQLLQRLQRVRPTVLQATPATWRMLLTAGAADFSDLTILCGGEALSPELRDQLLACKPAAFWNVYGPTETTVWSMVSEITSSHTAITIGHPIANMQVYILDANQQPVPVGILGELYIGGAGLGRGYLHQPALTQEKFIPHLFRTQTAERFYRTGDLARYLEDGSIDFLGRIDHQVKIRGFRIELGEIETVLQQITKIKQAVVIAREDTPGDKRLVSYLIADENPPTIHAVRTALKEKLPEYMVPAAFVFLTAFKLTPNGKIDRRALPAPTSLDLTQDATLVAPRTATEERLAHVWTDVLNLPQVSIHDNFFELGGHSLLVAQVISRLRQLLHVEIPNRSLFEMPTIALLAQHIDTLLQLPQQTTAVTTSNLTPMVRPNRIPASFSQQSLWFLQQLDPTNVAYNISSAYRLEGSLVISALEQSLNALVDRHETLRTTFTSQDGQALQVIKPAYAQHIPMIDIRGLSDTMRDAHIEQLARQESQTPFDLATGPLLRARLLRVDEQSHVLLLTTHHIIFDGWSIDVLLRDLTSLYQARVQGEPALLPALPIQYADYALWQKQVLQGQVLQDHLTYWQQHLKGAPNLITLPPDRPRPTILTEAGAQQKMILPAPLYRALKTLSQQEGVTLFMTLLATFQVVFMRSSGQTDLVLGVPVANRSRTEVEDLLGYFVNTLALRTDLSDNLSFHQLLMRVRDMTLQAFAHQDISFEQVIQSLQIERSASYTSLFQVMFSMQNAAPGALQTGGLSWGPIELASTSAKFDLTFEVQEREDGLQIRIEYNTNLYDASTIERLLTHWQVLLDAIIKDPTQPIESLSMLTDAEEEQILKQVCGSVVDFPALSLIDLFEQQVVAMPDAQAVTCNGITLTYRELNAQANSLAHRLRAMGVERNVLAGLCTMRSVEMIVGLLAILKAGGAYVALDPQLPTSRLQYQLDDTKATCVVTQASLQHLFVGYQGQILLLDEDVSAHVENLDVSVQLSDLAYIIYTSGSTGIPKGVLIPHSNISNYIQALRQQAGWQHGWQFATVSTLAADLGNTVIFGALISGGCLHILDYETATSAQRLSRYTQLHPLDVLKIVPSHLNALLAASEGQVQAQAILPRKQLIMGGESLNGNLLTRLAQLEATCDVINHYGPTETTIGVLTNCLGPVKDAWKQTSALSVPIGKPLSNIDVAILNAGGHLVPIGVVGELYIAGAGVARGYLNQPEQTATKFLEKAWGNQPPKRYYRTGDLAKLREDGMIEFIGRIDHQVKLRGFRIELGEIEAALQQQPGIRQAIAIVREDHPGDKRLVAYLLTQGDPPASETLRIALKEKLPDYMVPATFIFLDAFPLLPSGKIDRRVLPIPDNTPNRQDHTLVAPRTPVEEILASIWTNVLNLQQISIDDNFFELGGHSLLVMQVISRLRQSLHVEVPNRSLFEMPTIAALAQHIDTLLQLPQQTATGTGLALTSIVRPTTIPASFSQQSLWFLQQMNPTSVAYNIPLAYRLEGPLVLRALQQSLNALVHRHETLHTIFADQDGQAIQVIMPECSLDPPVIDIQGLPDTLREEYIQQLARQESQTPFNLETGPLLRVRLLRVDEQSHVLLLTTHHIVFDGWSIDILLRDLTSLYQAHVQGTPASLAALPIQYADYALWQKQWLQGQVLQDHLTYWQQHLAGAPSLSTLPPDRPRPTIRTEAGTQQKMILSAQLYRALKTLSQQEGVTLFMTLLATFQVVFMRSSGQTDLVLGVPVANRSRTEVEDLLGYFVNTLALRTDLSGNPSFHQLLMQVRDMTLQAYAHQDISFEQVIQSLQIERSASYTSLFQVMFSMQNAAPSTLEAGGLSWGPMELVSTSARFDLTFEAQEREDGLQIRIEYNTSLYQASTIERLLSHWHVLLQSIIEDSTQPVEALPMLTEDERHQLLETWNETTVAYPNYTTLCQLFEEQAARRPHATAVTSIDGTLSYQELNAKANQLARTLHKRGVETETLVGICMDRSTEMLVALLSILKAGGAYVPIDPTYPADRIAYMLEDSQAQCLLTQHHLLPLLSSTAATIICLDREWDSIAQEATDNVIHTITANNLAYILYTSGSTGRPKGVQIPHGSLINFELAMHDLLKLTEDDTFMAITTLSFDITGLELYLPLISGAQVSIETREVAADGAQLLQRLQEVRPTLLQATPATWRMLLAAGADDFSYLTILCGGEALPAELRDQLLLCKPVAFWNVYGPTETTIWSLASKITSSDAALTIGRPIANTQIYILDAKQQPMPIGIPGELYIGGDGLARGYLHQPELTQEKFISHPFRAQTTERLYRTGDLARYLEDGTIDFLGRIDHQVKIRGFRIELGEIETVLQQISEIKQAVVIDREDTPGDKRLVAYMIAGENQPTFQTLRATLKEKLPEYMIPATFVFLDALPLTPNGKINRKALPVPDMNQAAIATDSKTQPSEIMHYQLLNIWEVLLATNPISIKDNFFDLGGHSLLAARMLARIEQVFGKKISLSTLFAGPTIEDLTRVLMQQTQTSPKSPLIPVQVAGSGSKKPFFFLHGDWSGGAYYCFKLARKAGSDQPFYVIEPSIFPENREIPSIEGQAAAHLELVRSVQPEGPYYLGGYCNGSIIAYEMAQQLQEQGKQVKFLAMIDPPSESMAKNFTHFFNNTLHLSERPQWKTYLYTRHIYIRKIRPLLLRLSKTVDEQLTKGIQVSIEKDQAFTRLLPSMKTLRADYSSIFSWAFQHYTRKPYHGKITFIWAREELAAETNNSWNDRAQVEEANSHVITGSHYGILTDEIEAFAECLGTELQKAQAQNADTPNL